MNINAIFHRGIKKKLIKVKTTSIMFWRKNYFPIVPIFFLILQFGGYKL